MRRAGHKRPVSVRAIPATPSASDLSVVTFEDDIDARYRTLEIAIRQRIESRLPGRIRNLLVRAFDGVVILEGNCATYYTKQLAQHAAMGILEDEHLENSIVVSVQ